MDVIHKIELLLRAHAFVVLSTGKTGAPFLEQQETAMKEIADYIAGLEAENARLQAQLERLGIGDGVTHYDGCEEIHLACKVARLQEENARLREAARWIPVGERLPEEPGRYICGVTNKKEKRSSVYEVWFYGKEWDTFEWEVTHWRPLPEPPEKMER